MYLFHIQYIRLVRACWASIVSVTDRLTDLNLAHDEHSLCREKNNSPPYTTLFQLSCSSLHCGSFMSPLLYIMRLSAVCSRLGVFSLQLCQKAFPQRFSRVVTHKPQTVCKQLNPVFICQNGMKITFLCVLWWGELFLTIIVLIIID